MFLKPAMEDLPIDHSVNEEEYDELSEAIEETTSDIVLIDEIKQAVIKAPSTLTAPEDKTIHTALENFRSRFSIPAPVIGLEHQGSAKAYALESIADTLRAGVTKLLLFIKKTIAWFMGVINKMFNNGNKYIKYAKSIEKKDMTTTTINDITLPIFTFFANKPSVATLIKICTQAKDLMHSGLKDLHIYTTAVVSKENAKYREIEIIRPEALVLTATGKFGKDFCAVETSKVKNDVSKMLEEARTGNVASWDKRMWLTGPGNSYISWVSAGEVADGKVSEFDGRIITGRIPLEWANNGINPEQIPNFPGLAVAFKSVGEAINTHVNGFKSLNDKLFKEVEARLNADGASPAALSKATHDIFTYQRFLVDTVRHSAQGLYTISLACEARSRV